MKTEFPDDREFTITMKQLREAVATQCKPLEEAAFEAGKREGLRGAVLARAADVITAPPANVDPIALAAAARKIEVEEGLSNQAAVAEAYRRAGISIS